MLKNAILEAAEQAGDEEGMVGYLKEQAMKNPGPFMTLLGKVLPLQVGTADDAPMTIRFTIGGDEPSPNAGNGPPSTDLLAAERANTDGNDTNVQNL